MEALADLVAAASAAVAAAQDNINLINARREKPRERILFAGFHNGLFIF